MESLDSKYFSLVREIYSSIKNIEARNSMSGRMAEFFGATACEIRIKDDGSEIPIFAKKYTSKNYNTGRLFDIFFEISSRYVGGISSNVGDNFTLFGDNILESEVIILPDCRDNWNEISAGTSFFGAIIRCRNAVTCTIALQRADPEIKFGEPERLSMLSLMPHFLQSTALIAELSENSLQRELALKSLDRLSLGLALVSENAKVIFANEIARGVIGAGSLTIRSGVLCANNIGNDERLKRAIRNAASYSGREAGSAGDYFTIPRNHDGVPLAIRVSALPSGIIPIDLPTPAAIVFIRVPEKARLASPIVLKSLYGLTPAEIRLVQSLIEGDRLHDYAASARISINTAKTQLRNTFLKTGTTRQAELIRELASNLLISID